MYCSQCGHPNADGVNTCANCGAVLAAAPPPPPAAAMPLPPAAAPVSVPNNLLWAILATLCCCLPTGIVAIVFAAQVDSKAAAGDYAGAREASQKAAFWSWVSLGLGVVGGLAYGGLMMLGVVADAGSY